MSEKRMEQADPSHQMVGRGGAVPIPNSTFHIPATNIVRVKWEGEETMERTNLQHSDDLRDTHDTRRSTWSSVLGLSQHHVGEYQIS